MPAGDSYDGRVRVIWLDLNPADPTAPTMAELAAGVDLSDYVIPDGGFDPGTTNARTAGGSVNSSFDAEAPGRHGAQPSLVLKAKLTDTGATLAKDTLGARLVSGALVYFEDVDEGDDPAAGDDCTVYTGCKTLAPEPQPVASNKEKQFKVGIACSGDVYDAVVAA